MTFSIFRRFNNIPKISENDQKKIIFTLLCKLTDLAPIMSDAWHNILCPAELSVLIISADGFFQITSNNYPRRARSALGVDTVLTLDVCLYVCMLAL